MFQQMVCPLIGKAVSLLKVERAPKARGAGLLVQRAGKK
jgi:hypothetical protein